jgi:AcrR family transcriptional regulator
VDAIAKAAGCNKQLLYHYFKDKEGLFKAVMVQVLSEKPPIAMATLEQLEKHLEEMLEHVAGKRDWFRMMLWEVLQVPPEGPVVAEDLRSEHIQTALCDVSRLQKEGVFDPALPPRFVMLVMMGLLAFPVIMPHLARIVTGMRPGTPEFRAEHLKVVVRVARALGRA